MTAAAALALALAAAPAGASDALDVPSVEGRRVDSRDEDLARRMRAVLAEDPERLEALASRILRSSLAARLTAAGDPEAARAELKAWLLENPRAAADLAVGFAKDDARGDHAFEASLAKSAERFLELSPDRNKGILGRLDALGSASKAVKNDRGMSDDDRRRLMKELFEGKNTVDKDAKADGPAGGPRPSSDTPADAADAVWDRLSAANVTGYSPEVQALQSELNRQGVPGAPRLIETGKLDYPTLAYPAHAVRYDVERLEAALAREAAALGGKASGGAAAGGSGAPSLDDASLPAPLKRRREALLKARAALDALLKAAEPAKSPKAITPALMKTVAARRRDAARWVQLASFEETLAALESLGAVRTPAVKEALERCPATPEDRRRFWDGGAALETQAAEALESGRRARELLADRDDAASWAKAESLMRTARAAARRLAEEAALYRSAPERLTATARAVPRWRALAEDAAIRWLPSSAFASEASSRRKAALGARVDFARFLAP